MRFILFGDVIMSSNKPMFEFESKMNARQYLATVEVNENHVRFENQD